MKKALTLTLLGGLVSTAANAQVAIHVAGSTAFRANMFRAINDAFDGHAASTVNPANAGTGTGTVTFTGTISNLFGGQTVTVYAFYDGSVRGLADLQFGNNLGYSNATVNSSAAAPAPADITLSDVDKSSTLFPNAPTVEIPVAVLPFGYFRSYYATNSFGNPITAVTSKQMRSLFNNANGYLAMSFLTGVSADDTNRVYITGRNKDSGTRVIGDLDSYSGGTSPALWGFNTTAPNTFAQMNQNLTGAPSGFPASFYGPGYASGGNEASALASLAGTNANGSGAAFIGYLGLNDAIGALVEGNAAKGQNAVGNCGILKYDGSYPFLGYSNNVPANPDYTPVTTGQYSLWTYEQLEIKNTHTNDNVYIYATNLAAKLDSDILAAKNANGLSSVYGPVTAIRLSDMKVTRSSVGGFIVPNATP